MYTVGEVAGLAGISVRTLHHYDEIGLLSASHRSDAGYRLYNTGDVARLQQILFYRELGLPLDEIERLLNNGDIDRAGTLRNQRDQLVAKVGHLRQMVAAIDGTLAADEKGFDMDAKETLEVFGDFDPTKYQEEASDRWGHSDSYRESEKRTARYTTSDWERLGSEADEIDQAFLALMDAGTPSDSEQAAAVAERHRDHISTWFYDCSPEIHAGLGEMYAADQRFTERIDRAGAGLAGYMSDAILANSVRLLG